MRFLLGCASAMALTAACSTSQEAMQALSAMQIYDAKTGGSITYASLSGSGNDVTLKNVRFGEATGDQVAKGEATPMEGALKAATMDLKGLRMKDGKPVVGSLVIKDLKPDFEMGGVDLSLGSVGIEGLDDVTGGFVASAFTKEGPGEIPPFAQWRFKKASFNDLSIAGPIPQDEGKPGKMKVELGEVSVTDLKDTMLGLSRFGALTGEIDIPGTPAIAGTFDLGTVEVKNIRGGIIDKAVGLSLSYVMPSPTPPDFSALFGEFTSPLEAGYDAASWSGAKVNLSGLKFDATKASHTVTRNAEGVVIAASTPRYTMKLTADAEGGTLGAMGLMLMALGGYPSNAVELYAEGSATFDPAKDVTRWTGYNVGITDMIDVKVDAGLIGVQQALPTVLTALTTFMSEVAPSLEEIAVVDGDEDEDSDDGEDADEDDDADDAPDPADAKRAQAAQAMMGTMMIGLIGLQLTDLDVSITDKALGDLVLAQMAQQAGQSVGAYRQDLATMVSSAGQDIAAAGVDAELATELTTAVASFLKAPGTLRLQIKPKTPFGMMSAMMAPVTKQSLGFSATFTPLQPKTN